MADRAKSAAAWMMVVTLAALGAPTATASMVAWNWPDPPRECVENALQLPTTTGTAPAIWRKPHFFEGTPGHWQWSRGIKDSSHNIAWLPSASSLELPGEFPSAGWCGLQHAFTGEDYGPWAPFDYANLEDQGLIDGLQRWFGDAVPLGERNNFCVYMPPRPGDFLPPSPTIGGASYALMPDGAAPRPTGWNGLGRPTLGGVVDLVTGVPLIQVTDLELPFAGSTFRLIRTRSFDRRHFTNGVIRGYGNVIFAEHMVSHQPLHCGHKAAFVERLDVGVYSSSGENHRLIPFAHSISHMRNRAYAPGIGRFLQPDPNATAAVLLEASSYHGRGIGADPTLLDAKKLYGDGLSLYQYLKSNSLSNSDPFGLEVESEEEENFFSAGDLFDNVTDIMGLMDPVPGPSDMIRGAIKGLVEAYAQNLSADADWASDWSQADDDHSRLDDDWIMFAMGKGVYEEFDVGLPFSDRSINPLDFAKKKDGGGGGGGGTRKRASGAPRGGYSIKCANGHEAHRKFKADMLAKGIKGGKIRGGRGIPDATDYTRCEVWELKPFSPSGVLRGHKQLQGYVAELERLTGRKWTGHLVFYAPW